MEKIILKSNKILGLEKLNELGFNVPEFDYIPDFSELDLTLTDINPYYPPKELENLIKKKIEKINYQISGITVRSASFDEDNSEHSAAGRYLSFNGLISLSEIVTACMNIWQHHRQNSKGVKCPIIIQQTHPSFFSGVCFKDNETIVIESYYGACRNLVEGLIQPYTTIIKNNEIKHNYYPENNFCRNFITHTGLYKDKEFYTGKILSPKIDYFPNNCRVYAEINHKTIYTYGYRPPLPVKNYEEKIVPQLINISDALNSEKGVDIEWGSDENGNVYLYQFRALTRKIEELFSGEFDSNYVCDEKELIGIPTSKGCVNGIITSDQKNIKENSILLLHQDYIEDVSILENVRGIISLTGGILSHLSIMCRERGIPCIVSINKTIADGSAIVMDSNSGIIRLIKDY